MTIHCSFCDCEATRKVTQHDNKDVEMPLCETCLAAYEYGQATPEGEVSMIGEEGEEIEDQDEKE